MSKSNIEWTQRVWNPTVGCSKQSEGCKNCYAIRMAWRHIHNPKTRHKYAGTVAMQGNQPNWTGKVNLLEDVLTEPLRVKKPTTWFVNSMSDLFHPNIPFEFIDRVFAVMAISPQHTFQVLTKQPQRALDYFKGIRKQSVEFEIEAHLLYRPHKIEWPLPNVWLGASVENQKAADERIPLLLQVPAAVRFLSCEPLLGRVDLIPPMNYPIPGTKDYAPPINWVIAGGESGPRSRPMHPDWARSLRDQCAVAGVPFFFKQWGEYVPKDIMEILNRQYYMPKNIIGTYLNEKGHYCGFESLKHSGFEYQSMYKVGKKAAGRLLDGVEHNALPNTKTQTV